ncbi:hypothetical protein D3C80_1754430 [compost metagenome]
MYTNVSNGQFAQDAAQMLGCTSAAHGAVAYDTCCFVVPCFTRIIKCIFQCSCNAVVVFLHDKYEAVKGSELLVPSSCLLCSISLAEQRKLVVSDIHDLIVGVSAFVSDFFNPFAYLWTYAALTSASQDNSDV